MMLQPPIKGLPRCLWSLLPRRALFVRAALGAPPLSRRFLVSTEASKDARVNISAAVSTMRGGPRAQQRAQSQDARDAPRRCASSDSMKLSP